MLDLGRHWASVATAYDRSAVGKQLLADSSRRPMMPSRITRRMA